MKNTVVLRLLCLISIRCCTAYLIPSHSLTCRELSLHMKPLSREDEIRRKIVQLKKEGKVKGSSTSSGPDSYEDKVKQKLGKKKSQLLGYGNDNYDDDDEEEEMRRIQEELDSDDNVENVVSVVESQRQGKLGALPELQTEDDETDLSILSNSLDSSERVEPSTTQKNKPLIDPSLFEDDSENEPEMSEEELVELVAKRLSERRQAEIQEEQNRKLSAVPSVESADSNNGTDSSSSKSQKTTSGVGGTWTKEESKSTEFYKPKSGSWGAFPRPKDISKAYGGGRRVGAGFSKEDLEASTESTKKLLKDYRRKVGIDVPSEKEHAAEIEEALQIGQLAMQRGVYATAVSALEKVTKWCSTNSKVGSKVFLELAMAYEAVGRSQEAYQVYQTLSKCRMEDVKYNAKRLLYGMEAMEIMRDVSSDFSRKKIRNTFMDATGLGNIAQNFDDVYQTAYIDLESNFYKQLTESVVRSNREARQILLKATGKGEVGRKRIVQALRNIARNFDDALENEMALNIMKEPTAYIDGKPLVAATTVAMATQAMIDLDEFSLASAEQMMENLDGTWQLQLLADKSGDRVSFFNTTRATQRFSTDDMTFSASGPFGLTSIRSSGEITMDEEKRIISRSNVKDGTGGGGILGFFGGARNSGFTAAVSRQQQIMSVDSVLLITKSPPGSRTGNDAEKEHFGVWRKMVTP